MDNYPPGFDSKELDNKFENVELPEEQLAVRYELRVFCGEGEELVYESDFFSEGSVQGEGLRKANHAVDEWRTKALDEYIENLTEQEDGEL